jgi:hypothetical protein
VDSVLTQCLIWLKLEHTQSDRWKFNPALEDPSCPPTFHRQNMAHQISKTIYDAVSSDEVSPPSNGRTTRGPPSWSALREPRESPWESSSPRLHFLLRRWIPPFVLAALCLPIHYLHILFPRLWLLWGCLIPVAEATLVIETKRPGNINHMYRLRALLLFNGWIASSMNWPSTQRTLCNTVAGTLFMPRLFELRREEVACMAYRFGALVLSRDLGYPGLGPILFQECWSLIWEWQTCGTVFGIGTGLSIMLRAIRGLCGTSDSKGDDSRDECDALFLIRD